MSRLDARALSLSTGRPVDVLACCDSTNRLGRDVARDLLRAGPLPARLPVIVAEEQTAGRGRLGRLWSSAPSMNLLFSVLLAPTIPIPQAPRAVLAWAAALAQTMDCWLKWPNDLVDQRDRKLAGVLAEHEPGPVAGQVGCIVLGVGLNVNQREFPGLPGATSLALLRGWGVERQALLVSLIRALDAVDPAAADALDGWRARSRTLGRQVAVAGHRGRATGLREDGALLVDGRPVLAGDVELLSP